MVWEHAPRFPVSLLPRSAAVVVGRDRITSPRGLKRARDH